MSYKPPGTPFLRTDVRYMTKADLFKSSRQFLLVAGVGSAIMFACLWNSRWVGTPPIWFMAIVAFVLPILLGMALLGSVYLFVQACHRDASYDPEVVWDRDNSIEERVRTLNKFQRDTERLLRESLVAVGSSLEAYAIEGINEDWITARLSGSDLRVWIYEDGAQILSESDDIAPKVDDRFERPDYDTLEDLSAAFITKATGRVEERRANQSRPRPDPIL